MMFAEKPIISAWNEHKNNIWKLIRLYMGGGG